jgi:hypothetical protein
MQRRLGQEEHYNKEMSVLNHKLQSNVSNIRGGSFVVKAHEGQDFIFEGEGGNKYSKNMKSTTHNHSHFYPSS